MHIADEVKVQNFALVYEPATIDSGAFIGPAAVLTNDLYPRAVDPDGTPKRAGDCTPVGVHVKAGASVEAAVCVAPVSVGRWAMVAAEAVVTRDVPDYALVAGVPARQVGWVGRAGGRLTPADGGGWRCPHTGDTYVRRGNELAAREVA